MLQGVRQRSDLIHRLFVRPPQNLVFFAALPFATLDFTDDHETLKERLLGLEERSRKSYKISGKEIGL